MPEALCALGGGGGPLRPTTADPRLMGCIYSIEFKARFSNTVTEDDPVKSVYKAVCETEFRAWLKERHMALMHLMLMWCREFRDGLPL